MGEIKVLVLERHDVASVGLEHILEGSPAPAPDAARRLVLITGGGKADGYMVLQDVTAESLRAVLLAVLTGELRLPDALTTYLLDVAQGDRPADAPVPGLTPREHEVLELVVAGHSNQEIASELGISIHGAKRHVSSILGKFASPSRSHLVSRVLQARSGQALEA